MRNKMLLILGAVVILFGALYFANDFKNKKAEEKKEEKIAEKTKEYDNPYNKTDLADETIEELDDPLYQNQIIPKDLDTLLDEEKDVTVYFYKSDCPHCKVVTPKLVPMVEDMDIDMKKVNLLEFNQQEYWDRYFIESTPTLVHYKDGEEEARIVGENSEKDYKEFLNKYVVGDKEEK